MNDDLYIVIVDLRIQKEASKDLAESVLMRNASLSLANEPRCLRFDVVKLKETDGFLLYEIYENAQAFSDHLNTLHFLEFNDLSKGLFHEPKIRFGDLLELETAISHWER